MTKYKAQ